MLPFIKSLVIKWLSFTILRSTPLQLKFYFRNIEKKSIKLEKVKSHRSFNETCLINGLLPNYTNIRLHDDAARGEAFVNEFRANLVKRQIEQQSSVINTLTEEVLRAKNDFQQLVNSDLRLGAFTLLLERICAGVRARTTAVQNRKLCKLYGGPILPKQHRDSVVNLSRME